ncbi:MAG: DNA/RNA nuclease SfsA [Anaerolineae bacterium]
MEAALVERLNRFAVSVEVGGERICAHLPNSGRLTELLVPGVRGLLARHAREGRRTPYDLLLIRHAGIWVSVDARLPGPLFREAVQRGVLSAWLGFEVLKSEVRLGNSRLDLLLQNQEGGGAATWVEVKSVTLVRQGCALFPDAVTARGTRHLEELGQAARRGEGAAIVFIIQREDAECFRPHWESDPRFAQALVRVAREGVQVFAYRCSVFPREVQITGAVPVRLGG